jgi:UDP-MurNAc hydroxylase
VRINAIGHASWLLETSVGTILTDPVFFDPFEAGANASYPARDVDVSRLPAVDCIFLSHRHFDHFDIRTLATLDRRAIVFYPEGDDLIEMALAELGFRRRRALPPWAKVRLRNVVLIATPSHVVWPELGLVVHDGDTTLWSVIDSIVDTEIIDTLLGQVGSVDCLLAQYSPLFQYELRDPTALKDTDVGEYELLLRIVERTDPDVVIPSAGGLRYTVGEWQNAYGFPVSPRRFLADIARRSPHRAGILLEPGDRCRYEDGRWRIERQRVPGVVRAGNDDAFALWQLDPAIGIPSFVDSNPLLAAAGAACEYAERYIATQLVADLRHNANAQFLDMWRRWRTSWRIDLYVPRKPANKPVASWWLDLAGDVPQLAEHGPVEVTGRTAISASGIYDLLHGHCSIYSYLFTDRTRHAARTYAVERGKVTAPENGLPEPVLAALTGPRDLDTLFVSKELEKWRGRF